MSSIGEKMRHIRKARRWTQQKTADFLHIDRTSYTKYEKGTVGLTVERMVDWCRLFDVSPNELLGWEEEKAQK